jgi:hypothetical protein
MHAEHALKKEQIKNKKSLVVVFEPICKFPKRFFLSYSLNVEILTEAAQFPEK